ncbi:MAG: formate/nitrite transporter family protein [Verrucomicrobia bacterium]|nr:formate/nitrite transporter family protein [Verrucomicrobiota bacterium]
MSEPQKTYNPQLTSQEVGAAISHLGIKKANTQVWQLLTLGFLAGLYISFGSHLFLVAMEQGMGRIVAGACFSIGLVFVVIAGAELFTGNITMVVGAIALHYSFWQLLRSWVAVYIGNLIGAVLTAYLVYRSGVFGHGDALTATGRMAVTVADYKNSLPFGEAFLRGIFCNILVILGLIMSYFSKDVISKIVCVMLPIMTFVASGFEHCVANMYLIPAGHFAKGLGFADLTVMFHNILPVTLGNILGGLFIILIHPNRPRQIAYLLGDRRKPE